MTALLHGLLAWIREHPAYRTLRDALQAGLELPEHTLIHRARPPVTAALVEELRKPVVIVVPSVDESRRLVATLKLWLETPERLIQFPEPPVLFYERAPWTPEAITDRLNALSKLAMHRVEPTAGAVPPLIVTSVREIIDAVQPARTYYTLETMPWAPPHSPQSYLDLIEAVDRDRFGVHLDPVNLVNSPERYFDTTGLLRECFAKLGPWIRSCHAKDIVLDERLTVHLSEAAPGEGALDYATYLRELDALGADVPLLIEHLPDEESYDKAAAHIRSVAAAEGVEII